MIRITRIFVLTLFTLLLTCCSVTESKATQYQQGWQAYKHYYVEDGRVIDTANKRISHSEGQGYGMLFAVNADDQSEFDQIWQWTKNILQRDDKLFSWKYVPCSTKNSDCIEDSNNATDGDILIAWALLNASEQWNNPDYKTQALSIIDSIERKLIVKRSGYELLLPGAFGFDNADQSIQINLSYWVFPALAKFKEVTGRPVWNSLIESGEALLVDARFGRWKVAPDWLMITDEDLYLEGAISTEYGYNAVRVPIYLMLAGDTNRQLIDPYLEFWDQPTVPATVNLANGTVANYSYNSGMQAIAKATKAIVEQTPIEKLDTITAKTDYYSASLILLSHLALIQNESSSSAQ